MSSKRYEVKCMDYDGLPEEVKTGLLSNNGCGTEYAKYANYLLVYVDGELERCESDAMEPEDARFTRDLSWIKVALEEAFATGVNDPSEAFGTAGRE